MTAVLIGVAAILVPLVLEAWGQRRAHELRTLLRDLATQRILSRRVEWDPWWHTHSVVARGVSGGKTLRRASREADRTRGTSRRTDEGGGRAKGSVQEEEGG